MTDSLKKYIDAINAAKTMLKKGIINNDDLVIIDSKMCEKYCIKNNNLYRRIDLIYTRFRGNMCTTKGGDINGENSQKD